MLLKLILLTILFYWIVKLVVQFLISLGHTSDAVESKKDTRESLDLSDFDVEDVDYEDIDG